MMLMVSATNFIALYMGLELQSLALYVLAAFHRDSVRSTEAGLKYFVLGALSSGMLLYGISLIYGFTGTTDFAGVAHRRSTGGGVEHRPDLRPRVPDRGLAFKVSAVPFHMWTPDVYEGSPTPITAFFADRRQGRRAGAVLRAVVAPFPGAIHQWQQIIIVISVLSMALGAFAAIGQTNIKRLMAYSSIGHIGYALLGLAAGTQARHAGHAGLSGVSISSPISASSPASPRCGATAERSRTSPISPGLARTQPALAFAFAALMLSLAGLPPLAGIFAKVVRLPRRASQAHLYALAVFGVLASVVGAFYYLRIVKIMYFDEPARRFDRDMGWQRGGDRAASPPPFTLFFVVAHRPAARLSPARRRRRCSRDILAATATASKQFDEHRLHQRGGAPPGRSPASAGPLWITAARQTAGRGRRGRAWDSPARQSRRHAAARARHSPRPNARSSPSSPRSRRRTRCRASRRPPTSA